LHVKKKRDASKILGTSETLAPVENKKPLFARFLLFGYKKKYVIEGHEV